MAGTWTFGRKVALGFALVVAVCAASGLIGVVTLRKVAADKDRILDVNARNVIEAGNLSVSFESMSASWRGYYLTRDDAFLGKVEEAKKEQASILSRLRDRAAASEDLRLLDEIARAGAEYGAAASRAAARSDAEGSQLERHFTQEIFPKKDALSRRVRDFVDRQERLLEEGEAASGRRAERAAELLIALFTLAALLAAGAAWILTRLLSRQIGGAVQHVQSSSSELQAAANQQATGAREQSTSMNEISTTISELLATSRQIAEGSQRVAHIAEQTAQAAGAGDHTVRKSQDSMGAIRRQVEAIVTHMLDLGRKSQQIGGILEIINELSEQTNILSINASVEAAGAGEAGRRFAVVADEIRKLADRVGGSTKEIRSLIEEVRAAVNTTVMATEGGAKSVEAGAREFAELAESFRRIVALVETSTEAAKEIELSTKQQATAVEQVNAAIASVAQATRETEASAGQTLQTAGQLTTLSRELARLVRTPQAAPAVR